MVDVVKKTVLVVEDDPATQQLLVALMRRDGLSAVVAADGKEAIDLLSKNSYSVIILDLMMPAVGGREVIDYLMRQQRHDDVIVCTAAGPRMTADMTSPLIKGVVRKPFDIEELTGIVGRIVNR